MSFLSRFCEFRVWQLLGPRQFQHGIAEQEFIVPIVKPVLKVIKIGVQMLHRKLVVGANHVAIS